MSGACVAACPSFDRPPSLHRLRRRCHSALFEASSVLCSRPTPHVFLAGYARWSFPGRPATAIAAAGRLEASQVPYKGRLHVHGVSDCARLLVRKPFARGGYCLLVSELDRHLEIRPVSQLDTQPMVSSVSASRWPSRAARASLGVGAAGWTLPRGRLAPPILCQLVLAHLG